MASRRYVLISPCRDEAEYVTRTLDSVAAQTVPPALWIVVDDGSTDGTSKILDAYAARLPYLRVVHRTDRGKRAVGPGVIEAFYAGLDGIALDDFDYVCKLDVDLDLPPRYFEILMERMEKDERLGTTSGKPWFTHPSSGELVPEVCGDEMSVGMTKFYRVECFRDIGGFVRQVMWDGIDCHRARMLGWKAESVDDPEIRFLHLRPQGASQGKGIWTGRIRAGFGQYFMGTSPIYYLAVAVSRLPAHPAVYGSIGMLWGYASSKLKNAPRYDDLEFRRFVRSYQHASLVMGKHAATRKFEREREALFYATHPKRSTNGASNGHSGKAAELLSLPFDVATMQSAVATCLAWCEGPRAPHTVITANAGILCMMRDDAELRRACLAGDLVLADGMSVVWTSRLTDTPFPERVTGVDLMTRLLEEGGKRGLRVYFLGAKPEVVRELARVCKERWPGLGIGGCRDGYFKKEDHAAIVEEIRAAKPHMLFVGMPSPFKETWCERHRARLDVPVIMGVGGSFDVISGHLKRAPVWVQDIGMEWSWRLAMEPRKMWKRYLVTNTQFAWLAGREIVHRALSGRERKAR
jgi:exopolysaccharide biosynthesis WecB/TagA/CpsF family protein